MTSPRDIKLQITSISKVQKITRAMQNVAISKMKKAQNRMRISMPYANKIREVISHIANCDCYQEYIYNYLREHKSLCKVGYILISVDRGLCGGLNHNLFKFALEQAHNLNNRGIEVDWCLFGKKAEIFFKHLNVNITAHSSGLGENPKVSDLIGSVAVMLNAYKIGDIDQLFIIHNEFVNTLIQRPKIFQLLPITRASVKDSNYASCYVYELDSKNVLDTLITRYIEMQVYQAVVENIACEHVARMAAMKKATDNSKEIIESLFLLYNKVRQSAITREISEIINGSDAV